MRKACFLSIFCFFIGLLAAQNQQEKAAIDSLLAVKQAAKSDTTRALALVELSKIYSSLKDSLGFVYADEALKISGKTGFRKGRVRGLLSKMNYYHCTRKYDKVREYFHIVKKEIDNEKDFFSELGKCYFYRANVSDVVDRNKAESILYYDSSIYYNKLAGNEKALGSVYNNVGMMYRQTTNFPKALEHFLLAIDIRKKYKDEFGLGLAYSNISMVYYDLKQPRSAIAYNLKARDIFLKFKKYYNYINVLDNTGNVYEQMQRNDSALYYYGEGLKMAELTKDENNLSHLNNNIGALHLKLGNYSLAYEYFETSMAIKRRLNDLDGICATLINMAETKIRMKKPEGSESLLNEAMSIAMRLGSTERKREIAEAYSDYFAMLNKHEVALMWYKKSMLYKDSIFNNQTNKVIAEMSARYESEKKQQENELLKKEAGFSELKLQKERATKMYLWIFVGLIVVLSVVMLNAYLGKTKSNKLLGEKNLEIQSQKNEITDSINYAKRIQQAILPDHYDIEECLRNYFILYKPKDIVSGDFYYFKEDKAAGSFYVAVADCTGHGVPGAFMSLIGYKELEIAVNTQTSTGLILSELNKGVKQTLKQNNLEGTRDGMDIALCSIGAKSIEYSGANRSLWVLRSHGDLEEFKATKCAIGGFTPQEQEFAVINTDVQAGDTVYLFSDGLADQFGGEKKKKLTTRRLKQFLTDKRNLSMKEMKEELNRYFTEWKGESEQVDDILVIGIRFPII